MAACLRIRSATTPRVLTCLVRTVFMPHVPVTHAIAVRTRQSLAISRTPTTSPSFAATMRTCHALRCRPRYVPLQCLAATDLSRSCWVLNLTACSPLPACDCAQGRFLATGQYGENADVVVWDYATKKELYRCVTRRWGRGLGSGNVGPPCVVVLTTLLVARQSIDGMWRRRAFRRFAEHDHGIAALGFSDDEVRAPHTKSAVRHTPFCGARA